MRWSQTTRVACLLAWAGTTGCSGAANDIPSGAIGAAEARRQLTDSRPSLTVLEREGDARGALAIAVDAQGIAPDRGALLGVTLAALVEGRLVARGIDATASGGWDGWRLRVLVGSPSEAATTLAAVREAILAPVSDGELALAAVARQAMALAARPRAVGALLDLARCTGQAYASGADGVPSTADLEKWRAASSGFARVAVAVAGATPITRAVTEALIQAGPWPRGVAVEPAAEPPDDVTTFFYDAAGDIEPGAARIVFMARTRYAETSAAAAAVVADARGPLALRLAALDSPARIRSISATAHSNGGCLAITIDLDPLSLQVHAPVRIATAASLARQELMDELVHVTPEPGLRSALALRSADPRDAAETAAWWALSRPNEDIDETGARIHLIVGLAAAKDDSQPTSAPRVEIQREIQREIDGATLSWHSPVVEARTRVERGQGELWVLLASPCGTIAESAGDAGLDAAVALSAALRAGEDGLDARVEPYVSAQGVGVLVHGGARPGESATAHARRLGDIAARSLAAEAPLSGDLSRSRTRLLLLASESERRTLEALASVLSPGHPSWVLPAGTAAGLAALSDDAMKMRAAALRSGPLRVAVLANADAAQAETVVRAVDRWVVRRPGEARVCPPAASVAAPRPGTYVGEWSPGASSEAILGVALPAHNADVLTHATWLVAALGGPDGMLARSLGGGSSASTGQVTGQAAVMGDPSAPALTIRIRGSDASIDGAVAQVRALVEKLRLEGLTPADWSRAARLVAKDRLSAGLQPHQRVIDLWLSQPESPAPSIETMRAFAAAYLRDESLLIVAARPPRPEPQRPSESRDRRGKNRPQAVP